jgi:uncharacterized membrane protein
MNDVIELEPQQRSLKTIGHVSYLLHAIVAIGAVLPGIQASVALLVIAFALDMFKKDEALGSWQESHFRWRIRSVLWAGGLYVLTAPLWLLFIIPGWIAWAVISVWFLYRIVRGWMNLSNHEPMPR